MEDEKFHFLSGEILIKEEGRKRNVKFHRSGTLIVFKVVLYISFIGFLGCLIRWYFLNTQRILHGGEKIWILCSSGKNIKFISSSQRVMFFLLYGETNSTKAKGGIRDVIKR